MSMRVCMGPCPMCFHLHLHKGQDLLAWQQSVPCLVCACQQHLAGTPAGWHLCPTACPAACVTPRPLSSSAHRPAGDNVGGQLLGAQQGAVEHQRAHHALHLAACSEGDVHGQPVRLTQREQCDTHGTDTYTAFRNRRRVCTSASSSGCRTARGGGNSAMGRYQPAAEAPHVQSLPVSRDRLCAEPACVGVHLVEGLEGRHPRHLLVAELRWKVRVAGLGEHNVCVRAALAGAPCTRCWPKPGTPTRVPWPHCRGPRAQVDLTLVAS